MYGTKENKIENDLTKEEMQDIGGKSKVNWIFFLKKIFLTGFFLKDTISVFFSMHKNVEQTKR